MEPTFRVPRVFFRRSRQGRPRFQPGKLVCHREQKRFILLPEENGGKGKPLSRAGDENVRVVVEEWGPNTGTSSPSQNPRTAKKVSSLPAKSGPPATSKFSSPSLLSVFGPGPRM